MGKTKRMLAALAASLLAATAANAASPWGENYFPNSTVITQDGTDVKFFDDLIRDRMVVISFIYTSCRDLCPINTARLAEVARRLEGRMGEDIFFVSISVDPLNDTPERLKAFADAFYDGPGWTFITGDEQTLRLIGSKLGNNSEVPANHRNEVVLGNALTGDWSRNTPFGEIETLTSAVLDLDPVWREQRRMPDQAYLDPADLAGLQISAEPGQALFKKMCAPCHTVGVGDMVGPDLMGVTERRERDWLAAFIRDPETSRRAGDPVALDMVARFPGVRMPSFALTENDAADLINYLETRTKDIMTARADAIAHDADPAHHHGDHAAQPVAAVDDHAAHDQVHGEGHSHAHGHDAKPHHH
jgi:protein SCO1